MVINTNNDLGPKANGHSNHKVTTTAAHSEQKQANPASAPQKDQVQLSPQAQGLAQLEAKVYNSEGVDSQKVEDLRQRIESGDYTVDANSIAQKLVDLDR